MHSDERSVALVKTLCVVTVLTGQIALPVAAADNAYTCQIVDVRSVEPDGTLIAASVRASLVPMRRE